MGENNDNNNKNDLETAVTLEPPVVREPLVQTAIQFLQNPKTRASSLKLKILFLKKKGLTEDEIQLAIDRSGTALYEDAKNSVRDATQAPPLPPPHYSSNYNHQMAAVSQPPRSPFLILRDIANTVVALGGIGYFVYWLYKRFIWSWLFGGGKPKRKLIDEQLTDLDVTLTEVKQEVRLGLARLGADVEALTNQRTANGSRDLQELTSQVATIKGLLLNRSQFPAVPPTTAASPAKIPSWQLDPSTTVGSSGGDGGVGMEGEGQDAKNKMAADEEEEDAESSKSTAEGSDSSLEMISSITNHHESL